jgi:hypothetical protein
MSDDADLRERFAALRDEDALRTPGLAVMLRRRRRSPRRRSGVLAAGAVLAAAVAALVVLEARHDRPAVPMSDAGPRLVDWRAPTDFLLNTPGLELMHGIPQIGGSTIGPHPGPDPYDSTAIHRAGEGHRS